jgi:pimeloyl-ACP methyl ester carboxylesterase
MPVMGWAFPPIGGVAWVSFDSEGLLVGVEAGEFQAVRSRLISRLAAGASVRRLSWSNGDTDVLELGSGRPLLLIHGGLSSSCEWVPIMGALADDYRVFAVDQPGHGGADAFDYTGVDLNAHSVRFVGEILDALSLEQSAIMANSIGGLLAARFAEHSPNRVTKLVFAGFPAGLRRRTPLPFRMLALPGLPRLAFSNPNAKSSRKFMADGLAVAHPELLPDELVDCDVANTYRHMESFITLVKRIANLRGLRRRWLLGDSWRKMPNGTTILWGENEPWATPEWGTAKLSEMETAISVVPIPGAGHLPWWDQPDLVVQEARRVITG